MRATNQDVHYILYFHIQKPVSFIFLLLLFSSVTRAFDVVFHANSFGGIEDLHIFDQHGPNLCGWELEVPYLHFFGNSLKASMYADHTVKISDRSGSQTRISLFTCLDGLIRKMASASSAGIKVSCTNCLFHSP
jgi:hypothetical protein